MSRGERSGRREARREELLDAAVEVVRVHGPAVSMHRIAAGAGVTKPILYRHFGDRQGLVAALSMRFVGELDAALAEAMTRPGQSPRDLLVAAIDAYLSLVERDPHVYRFVAERAASEDPVAQVAVTAYLHHLGARVASLAGEALRERGLDSGPAEPWGYGIVGMVHLVGDWWLERPVMPRERVVAYLADLLWGGLAGAGLAEDATPIRGRTRKGRTA